MLLLPFTGEPEALHQSEARPEVLLALALIMFRLAVTAVVQSLVLAFLKTSRAAVLTYEGL